MATYRPQWTRRTCKYTIIQCEWNKRFTFTAAIIRDQDVYAQRVVKVRRVYLGTFVRRARSQPC